PVGRPGCDGFRDRRQDCRSGSLCSRCPPWLAPLALCCRRPAPFQIDPTDRPACRKADCGATGLIHMATDQAYANGPLLFLFCSDKNCKAECREKPRIKGPRGEVFLVRAEAEPRPPMPARKSSVVTFRAHRFG